MFISASNVISCNAAKMEALRESLERQQKKNDIVDQHRSHVVASAGLTGDNQSNELTNNINDFVNDTNKEIEKLTVKVAQATHKYTSDLNNFLSELKKCGTSTEDINSLTAKS